MDQDGSLRALNKLNEDSSEALEQIRVRLLIEFRGASQQLYRKDFSLVRLSLEIWPRAETSTE